MPHNYSSYYLAFQYYLVTAYTLKHRELDLVVLEARRFLFQVNSAAVSYLESICFPPPEFCRTDDGRSATERKISIIHTIISIYEIASKYTQRSLSNHGFLVCPL